MPWVDIDYARAVVRQMYSGDRWRSRVRHMPDDQILAIKRIMLKNLKPVNRANLYLPLTRVSRRHSLIF